MHELHSSSNGCAMRKKICIMRNELLNAFFYKLGNTGYHVHDGVLLNDGNVTI